MSIFKIGSMGRANIEAVDSSRSGAIAAPHFDLLAKNHVRDTVATHWDDELLRRYGIGELRRLASWGDGSAYFEGERTNVVPDTKTLAYNLNATPVVDALVGPDGVSLADASSYGTDANVRIGSRATGSPFAEDVAVCFSSMIKPVTDHGSDAWDMGGRTYTGVVFGPDFSIDPARWVRQSHVASSGFHGATYHRIHPRRELAGLAGTMGVTLMQMELGEFPSMPIETFGVATTRDEDDHVVPQAEVDPTFFTGASELHTPATPPRSSAGFGRLSPSARSDMTRARAAARLAGRGLLDETMQATPDRRAAESGR